MRIAIAALLIGAGISFLFVSPKPIMVAPGHRTDGCVPVCTEHQPA